MTPTAKNAAIALTEADARALRALAPVMPPAPEAM